MRRYDPETVRDIVLGYLGRSGYFLTTTSGNGDQGGRLVILQNRFHRAIARFEFGIAPAELGPAVVEELKNQKATLQASAAFLITDAELMAEARDRVGEAGITVIAGRSLENLILASQGATWPPQRPPEDPLPFQRYIPWFVGISLTVILLVVLALISAELTIRPIV